MQILQAYFITSVALSKIVKLNPGRISLEIVRMKVSSHLLNGYLTAYISREIVSALNSVLKFLIIKLDSTCFSCS